jgi:hypothetical protein
LRQHDTHKNSLISHSLKQSVQESEDDGGHLRWDSYAKNIDDVEDIDDVDDTSPDGGDNITSKTHTDNQNTQYPFRVAV